jgi:hypothetical protein
MYLSVFYYDKKIIRVVEAGSVRVRIGWLRTCWMEGRWMFKVVIVVIFE